MITYNSDRSTWPCSALAREQPTASAPAFEMKVADMDNDGDIDLVCPGKSGLYWLENLRLAAGDK